MSKPTLATIKRFIKANRTSLHISCRSNFNGMTDSVEACSDRGFSPAVEPENGGHSNQLGIRGAWFVFGSRDYFEAYSDGQFVGFKVYNCCGSFILAVPAVAVAA